MTTTLYYFSPLSNSYNKVYDVTHWCVMMCNDAVTVTWHTSWNSSPIIVRPMTNKGQETEKATILCLDNESSNTIKTFLISESIDYPPAKKHKVNDAKQLTKLSKIISSVVYAQLNLIFPSNFGTSSYLKPKTASTWSTMLKIYHQNQCTNYSMDITTSMHNLGHYHDAKQLSMNIYTSWGPRGMYIKDIKKYWFYKGDTFLPKFWNIPKVQPWDYTMQIAKELLIEMIKLNKGKEAWEPQRHLHASAQLSKIFKITTDATTTRVTTSTMPTMPAVSHLPTHKDAVKSTQHIHQQQTHNNAPITPATPASTSINTAPELRWSPLLQNTIITQEEEEALAGINLLQHQIWHNPHKQIKLKSQSPTKTIPLHVNILKIWSFILKQVQPSPATKN